MKNIKSKENSKNVSKIEKNIQNEQNLIENINKFSSKKLLKNLSSKIINNFDFININNKKKQRQKINSSSNESTLNKFYTNNSTNNLIKINSELNKEQKEYEKKCKILQNRILILKTKDNFLNNKIKSQQKKIESKQKIKNEKNQFKNLLKNIKKENELNLNKKHQMIQLEKNLEIERINQANLLNLKKKQQNYFNNLTENLQKQFEFNKNKEKILQQKKQKILFLKKKSNHFNNNINNTENFNNNNNNNNFHRINNENFRMKKNLSNLEILKDNFKKLLKIEIDCNNKLNETKRNIKKKNIGNLSMRNNLNYKIDDFINKEINNKEKHSNYSLRMKVKKNFLNLSMNDLKNYEKNNFNLNSNINYYNKNIQKSKIKINLIKKKLNSSNDDKINTKILNYFDKNVVNISIKL